MKYERHGQIDTALYRVWDCMKQRCYNSHESNYPRYGGRGIQVCTDWLNSFSAFKSWADSSGYKPWLQIDRIDNDGDYSPENCRWVTSKVQARNRSTNRFLTAFGETKLLIEWAEDERCKTTYVGLRKRLKNGWPPEKAITANPNSKGT